MGFVATKPDQERFLFRLCLKVHIHGKLKNRGLRKTLALSSLGGHETKYDHKTSAMKTHVLYMDLSNACSYRMFLRAFLRNALNFLLKQASERASYTLPTFSAVFNQNAPVRYMLNAATQLFILERARDFHVISTTLHHIQLVC